MEVSISKLAYTKMFLHLSKYPHSSCNGLLLSRVGGDNQHMNYVDCVPLFHSSLSLAPSLEIALFQIDSHCEQNDLEITGYYQASENIHNNQPNLITYKIAEKLKENSSMSLVFMVDNNKVHPTNKKPCFTAYQFIEEQKRLKELNCNVKLEEQCYEACFQLLKEKQFNNLVDFDQHLDDLNKDWRNAKMQATILNSPCVVETIGMKKSN